MRAIESLRNKQAAQSASARLDSLEKKLDALLTHSQIEMPQEQVEAEDEGSTAEVARTYPDDTVQGVALEHPVQAVVPPEMQEGKLKVRRDLNMDGGRANGEKPHRIKDGDAFPDSTPQDTRATVTASIQEEAIVGEGGLNPVTGEGEGEEHKASRKRK